MYACLLIAGLASILFKSIGGSCQHQFLYDACNTVVTTDLIIMRCGHSLILTSLKSCMKNLVYSLETALGVYHFWKNSLCILPRGYFFQSSSSLRWSAAVTRLFSMQPHVYLSVVSDGQRLGSRDWTC